MAIARPVRALGLVALVMWCFFIWQLFKPTSSHIRPADPNLASLERDPNHDRKHATWPL